MYAMSNLEGEVDADDYQVDNGRSTYVGLCDIVDGLSGTRLVLEVPTVLDESVKDALLEFCKRLDRVKGYQPMVPDISITEIRQVSLHQMTLLCMLTTWCARPGRERILTREREIFWVAIASAVVSASWAFLLFCIIGSIWKHYYEAHTSLDLLHKGHSTAQYEVRCRRDRSGRESFRGVRGQRQVGPNRGDTHAGEEEEEEEEAHWSVPQRVELENSLVLPLGSSLPSKTFMGWVRCSW
ncbi:unnamed protein product [Prorocentrum cordatum]|uniref:Uncharacterized protein n=1 Tax=Prorocentrum cordatum TaxID=2364126 RepID=A0ABN9VEM7_9DINO|nr:unnamed protein product [Polarella glacialis]